MPLVADDEVYRITNRLVTILEAYQARGFRVLALKVSKQDYRRIRASINQTTTEPFEGVVKCCDIPLQVSRVRDPDKVELR